jgi:predicted metal-dependent hydrolase
MFNFLNKLFNEEPSSPKKEKKTPKKRPNVIANDSVATEGGVKRIKSTIEQTIWLVHGQDMPVEIHREKRTSWRYSFAKGRLLVRLPLLKDGDMDAKIINDIRTMLEKKTENKPQLFTRYDEKTYKDGDTLAVGNRTYYLKIENEARKTHAAKMDRNKVIHIALGEGNTEGAVSKLLSRIVAKDFSAEFSRRVFEINHQFFKKPIKSVNFKYNHSNWGSCSSTGNLNFSTRLFFAPDEVQDYVIIHELAHLIELNHSDRFWNIVEAAMPNYAEKEKWLKKNGHLCRF